MRILFTGGGTGGHIFPIVAIVREIRNLHPQKGLKFFYLGPRDRFERKLLSEEGIKVKTILAGKLRRYFTFKSFFENLFDLIKIPLGVIQAFLFLIFIRPNIIFSKGGFGSFPTVFAGWMLGIPIFLHESDATPGLSNKILSRFAQKIFVSFPETEYFKPSKTILSGNPVREEILLDFRKKEATKKHFGLEEARPVILILGGSQGSYRINEKMFEVLPEILKNFSVIHQCGKENFKKMKERINWEKEDIKRNYRLFGFLEEEDLSWAYLACDLVVSRAGSGTIFEIAAFAKPSILIPLPESAQNHQLKNALSFAKNGAALIIEEEEFKPDVFLNKLIFLFTRPEDLKKMSRAAQSFSKPNAAKTIANYVLDILNLTEQDKCGKIKANGGQQL